MKKTPPARQQMNDLIAAAQDATARFVEEIPMADPHAIVRALGDGFSKDHEYTLQGGHTVTVLRGRNGNEAVINATRGRVTGNVRIFRPSREGKS